MTALFINIVLGIIIIINRPAYEAGLSTDVWKGAHVPYGEPWNYNCRKITQSIRIQSLKMINIFYINFKLLISIVNCF